MRLRIVRPRLRSLPLQLRTGDGRVETECHVLRLEVELFGRPYVGYAAMTLPAGADAGPQADAIQRACSAALQLDARHPFDFCLSLHAGLDPPSPAPTAQRRLLRRAAALVERALLDAVARRAGRILGALLLDRRDNPLRCEWGRFHPLLRGLSGADFLPPFPFQTQIVRLPVHPGDPLGTAEETEDRPRSLATTIRRSAIHRFQIRVRSVHDIDYAAEALRCIRLHAPPTWSWSLDGSGAYPETTSFFETWTELRSHPELDDPLRRLEFIVHPFEPGEVPEVRIERFFKGWPARLPVLLDPSGVPDAAVLSALRLGYRGFVLRSDTGLLRTVAWAGLIARLREERQTATLVATAVGADGETPFGLAQDAVIHAVAGNDAVVRRSLVEVPDLRSQPLELQSAAIRDLASLYEAADTVQAPEVAVRAGRIRLASALAHPTGLPGLLGDCLFGMGDLPSQGRRSVA